MPLWLPRDSTPLAQACDAGEASTASHLPSLGAQSPKKYSQQQTTFSYTHLLSRRLKRSRILSCQNTLKTISDPPPPSPPPTKRAKSIFVRGFLPQELLCTLPYSHVVHERNVCTKGHAGYITQFGKGSLEIAAGTENEEGDGNIASNDACHGPECEMRAVCDSATAGYVGSHPAPIVVPGEVAEALESSESALSSASTPIAQDAPQDALQDSAAWAADGHQHSKQSADVSLYHATSLEAALRIQAEGFRIPKGPSRELLGPGVYASATLQKALQYCGGPEGGIVFELAVDLGRCKILEENDPMMTTWQQHGYDSAYAPTGAGGLSALAGIWRTLLGGAGLEEHCIKDPRRIAIKQAIAGHTSQLQQAGYTIVGGEIVKVR